MPAGFTVHRSLAPSRRPIALIAVWLVVLQAFLTGVVTAQSGTVPGSDPLGAICHGSDGAPAPDGTAPDTDKVRHLCCEYCTSAPPVLAPPDAMAMAAPPYRPASQLAELSRFIIIISPGVIRAGASQAPPASA